MACRSRPSWIIPAHAVSQCRTNNIVTRWPSFNCGGCGAIASKGKRVRGSGEMQHFTVIACGRLTRCLLLCPTARSRQPSEPKTKEKDKKHRVFLISLTRFDSINNLVNRPECGRTTR